MMSSSSLKLKVLSKKDNFSTVIRRRIKNRFNAIPKDELSHIAKKNAKYVINEMAR